MFFIITVAPLCANADFRFGACCSANGGVCGCKGGGAVCCDGKASTCPCDEKDFRIRVPAPSPPKTVARVIPEEHRAYLPDPKLTPGDVRSKDKKEICAPGYIQTVGRTTETMKNELFKLYKIVRRKDFEIDHLVSKGLGGSKDKKNLYPQALHAQWNMHKKDQLENHLHRLVCAGKLDLAVAQQEIAFDWIAAYKKYMPQAPAKNKKPSPKKAAHSKSK